MYIFPQLLQFGLLISCGCFAVTPVTDREEKLRYLLNFSGMSPTAYFFGFLLSDAQLFLMPNALLVITSWILGYDFFINHWFAIMLALYLFGYGFIALSYLVGFIFQKSESAFKYTFVVFLLMYAVPTGLKYTLKIDALNEVFNYIFPMSNMANMMGLILAPEYDASLPRGTDWSSIWHYYLIFVVQSMFYISICIVIDTKMVNNFRGEDGRQSTETRLQLEEDQDVIMHRDNTKSGWLDA